MKGSGIVWQRGRHRRTDGWKREGYEGEVRNDWTRTTERMPGTGMCECEAKVKGRKK
jgi:hypothetical protein